jgi:hypothetical protein
MGGVHAEFEVNLRERYHYDDPHVGGRIIGWGVMNCIHLAQDKDLWRGLVNTVMKIRVP